MWDLERSRNKKNKFKNDSPLIELSAYVSLALGNFMMPSTNRDNVAEAVQNNVNTFREIFQTARNEFLESSKQYSDALKDNHDFICIKWICNINELIASDAGLCVPTLSMAVGPLAQFRQILWEKLHVVHWHKTPLVYRCLFGDITCLLVSLSYLSRPNAEVDNLILAADLGLLLGTPDSAKTLNTLVSCLGIISSQSKKVCNESSRMYGPGRQIDVPGVFHNKSSISTVSVVDQPTVLDFYDSFFVPQIPVVMTNCASDWPAINSPDRNWQDLNYITKVAGHRSVPIETGTTYLSEGAGTSLMTIHHFISSFILSPVVGPDIDCTDASIGYLAQHELLEQIPSLKSDICVPDYCSLLLDMDEAVDSLSVEDTNDNEDPNDPHDVRIQAWFGPFGTVSPLHYDAYHNILVQLSGYKFVRLFPPSESMKLYPMDGKMVNNSQVDLLAYYKSLHSADQNQYHEKYPLTANATFFDCIIGPGDMIFIPRWWWHYIQAIDEITATEWERLHAPVYLVAYLYEAIF